MGWGRSAVCRNMKHGVCEGGEGGGAASAEPPRPLLWSIRHPTPVSPPPATFSSRTSRRAASSGQAGPLAHESSRKHNTAPQQATARLWGPWPLLVLFWGLREVTEQRHTVPVTPVPTEKDALCRTSAKGALPLSPSVFL